MEVVHEGGKKRKGDGSGDTKKKKNKSGKTKVLPSTTTPLSPIASKAEILTSFSQVYQGLIKTLPGDLWPTSVKHGEHSYTVFLGSTCFFLSNLDTGVNFEKIWLLKQWSNLGTRDRRELKYYSDKWL